MTTTRTKTSGRGALVATRALSGIVAALVLIQGTLAGFHLNGTGGAIGVHGAIGSTFLPLLTIAVIATAVFAFRQNRWALPISILGFMAMGAQIGMGYESRLNVHLPLGIALFGLYLTIAYLAKPQFENPKEES